MQKEFIDIAAHELRTPVQPILGLSDVLLSKKGDIEQYKELLDAIKRNAKRLQRLTEDILDVTKIESQSLQLTKQRINLNEVILGIIAEYSSQIEKKVNNVNLSFKSKDDDIFVEADRLSSNGFENLTLPSSNCSSDLLNNAGLVSLICCCCSCSSSRS
jgi:two-component system sensor histidine kinase VicK